MTKSDDSSCVDAVRATSDYLDGALLDRDLRSLEAHVASCSACSGVLSELRHTLSILSQLPRPPAPSRLKERLSRELSRSRPAKAGVEPTKV
jgi:anti-sigma factor RsiW